MTEFLTILKLEILKIVRQPITVFFALVFPPSWLVLQGNMYGNTPSNLFDGVGTIDFMFGALVFLVILVNGLSNLPLLLSKNIENKIYKRYAVSPMKKSAYLLAIFTANIILVLVSSALMVVTARLMYSNFVISPDWFWFIVFTILSASGVCALGVIIASIVPNFSSVLSVAFLIYFAGLFFSGASVPLPVLPSFLQKQADYNIFAFMVKNLQEIWIPTYQINVFYLIASISFSVLMILLSIKLFKWEKM